MSSRATIEIPRVCQICARPYTSGDAVYGHLCHFSAGFPLTRPARAVAWGWLVTCALAIASVVALAMLGSI